MRRLLFVLSLTFAAIVCEAQVVVETATKAKRTLIAYEFQDKGFLDGIGSLEIGLVELGDGHDFALYVGSSNRYDDEYIISLGSTVESAEETLSGLLGLFDTSAVGDALVISTPEPESFTSARHSHSIIMTTKYGGKEGKKARGMQFVADDYAGIVLLQHHHLEVIKSNFKSGVKLKRIKL